MGIWDRVKPAHKPPEPTAVKLEKDGKALAIAWDDGKDTAVAARTLRQVCPCAECVDEWTHQRTLDVEKVPQDLSIAESRAVGNYALGFRFSDGHQTGIFHWTFLRETSEKHPLVKA